MKTEGFILREREREREKNKDNRDNRSGYRCPSLNKAVQGIIPKKEEL